MANENWWQKTARGSLLLFLILASPLAGVMLEGESPRPYLEFPPETIHVEQPAFSWTAFFLIVLFIAGSTWPFWRRLAGGSYTLKPERQDACRFPWWGRAALAGTALFWILAWSRFSWFEPFQRHTFFPLWFCMIILLNAFAFRLSCRSLLTHRTQYFILLFPVSAAFWWIFEYLNRFVNNWYYTGMGELGRWQYFLEATLAFSTVLPAVLSMRFILLRLPLFSRGFTDFPASPWMTSRSLWTVLGLVSILGLTGTGWRPDLAYPLIWISPVLLWIAFQKWTGYTGPLLKQASRGDLTLVWASAAAALLCGFFWEMWNVNSEAKWIYNIPGLEKFYLFEMPLPGYAGYLPFGVVCALAGHSLFRFLYRKEMPMDGTENPGPAANSQTLQGRSHRQPE